MNSTIINELPDFKAISGQILKYTEKNCNLIFTPQIKLDNEIIQRIKADIYVGTRALVLWNSENSLGLSIPYQKILLCAVSKQGDRLVELPNIYVQLDLDGELLAETPNSECPVIEMSIIPPSEDALDEIFLALSECQSGLSSLESETSNDYVDVETAAGSSQAAYEHLEQGFQMPPRSQFENVLQGQGRNGSAIPTFQLREKQLENESDKNTKKNGSDNSPNNLDR